MTRWLPSALPVIALALVLPSAADAHNPAGGEAAHDRGLAGGRRDALGATHRRRATPVPRSTTSGCSARRRMKPSAIRSRVRRTRPTSCRELDAGRRLAVRAHAVNSAGDDRKRSRLTEVVTAPVRPAPSRSRSRIPGRAPRSRLPSLRRRCSCEPFPIVRIKGKVLARGARITLLRVRAPSGALVAVRCKGPGCGLRRRSFGWWPHRAAGALPARRRPDHDPDLDGRRPREVRAPRDPRRTQAEAHRRLPGARQQQPIECPQA